MMKNYMRAGILTMLVLFFGVGLALAQTTVSGRVTSQDDGTVLPGVSVSVKGTTRGTTTDGSGRYSLAVDGSDAVLVFSFIGYTNMEVAVGNRSNVDVALVADLTALSEVVVTGYTTESKREFTGSVSTVKSRELVAVPSGNVEQQLQGRVAGVTLITNGQPGTTSIVRVRGFGAFGGNEPLYIVDGLPTGNIDFLQPDDVESTTVLKDAPAASIYGARAANGVIVIVTKQGKYGQSKFKVSYDGLTGFTEPGKVNDILTPQESADWTWQAIRNTAFNSPTQAGTTPTFGHPQYGTGSSPVLPEYILVGTRGGVTGGVDLTAERAKYNIDPNAGGIYQVTRANQAGTNWWDEITRRAPLNRHLLSFSGGGENSRVYLSMGMQDQKGILINQDFRRYSLRANSEFKVLKNFRIGENFQVTYRSRRGVFGGGDGRGAAGEENNILDAFRMHPLIPVYDEFGGYAGTRAPGFNNPRNPVASRQRSVNNLSFNLGGFGNLYAEADVVKGLTLRSSIGGNFGNYYYNFYNPRQYENSENNAAFQYGEGGGFGYSWTFTNTARYQNKFGVHGVDVLLGQEALNTGQGRGLDGSGLNPFSTDPNFVSLSNTQAVGRQVFSGYGRGTTFYSLFSKVQYSFREKYILSGVVRRDAVSRFGPSTRFGFFPAVSAAWRISEEAFMKDIPFVSDLKIRGGYGTMGNSNNVDPNNQFNLFGASIGNSSYDIGGTNNSAAEGFYRSRLGNPLAKWEEAVTSNIGIDGVFFNGKLEVIFDLWRKDTRDLLFTLETPAVVGPQASDPAVNIAKMRNQGIDLQIINKGQISSELAYEVNLTGGWLKNEIVALAPGVTNFDAGGSRIGTLIRNEVGRPLSSFFGYKVVGLFQNQAEIDAAPKQDGVVRTQDIPANAPAGTRAHGAGRFRFADLNGDNLITSADRTYLGNPIPKFNGGVNIRLTYRAFELETFLYTALGLDIYRFSKWYTDFYPSFTGAAYGVNVKNSWTPERGGNTVPIFENVSNFSTNNQSNSYYVENGSYMRLTNLQIGYKLPAAFLTRYGIERARVFVQATNLFTLTKYSGQDPGVGGAADTNLGIDIGNPPVTKGFNVGLGLTF